MSLASIKTKQEQCLNDIYTSLEEQGATIPDKKNLVNVAPAIESIEGGGSGPKFIDYIESTGTQYIDTKVLPNSNMKVEIDFQIIGSSTTDAYQPIFGFRLYGTTDKSKKTDFAGYYSINDKTLVTFAYGSTDGNGNISSAVTNRTKLIYDNTGLYENGNQIVSKTEETFEETTTRRSITIFGLRTDDSSYPVNYSEIGRLQLMKLYSFKVYKNDVLIRNFKPCIDPNGVYCLYELVEGKYYYNQGTGSFGGEGIPTQVINYQMLYDGSLGESGSTGANVCADVTGGFTLLCASDTGTVTYNSNNVTVKTNGDSSAGGFSNVALFTNLMLSFLNYTLAGMYAKLVTYSSTAQNGATLGARDKKGYGSAGEAGSTGIGTKTANTSVAQTGDNSDYANKNFLYDLDISKLDSGYVNPSIIGGKPSLIMYDLFLLKQDNWQELCTVAGLTSSDYTDEVALCADSIAISTILSNEEAVKYMIYNCTGTFMYYFVRNIDCLTALNNSTYKTLVQSNEHWNKFLNMVA